ncbi:uncharacterized protein BO87DRAFT_390116 [Aspergillus neoniger CBS 115656]|uniref:Uncharacterized protein n=1 Tax=Aspergillus neoniger (strain CBS 115656) TaxID=1448310 RepID=A0A318Y7W0_ASPNB|nr:hypothetical protein BO87DRAFT_390116 [Aspergillus neoniger CBS 115656]PYH30361.1 hypothetical protein BO87DRAFT_390116 [Aspergillus neoniger CBS 115656]
MPGFSSNHVDTAKHIVKAPIKRRHNHSPKNLVNVLSKVLQNQKPQPASGNRNNNNNNTKTKRVFSSARFFFFSLGTVEYLRTSWISAVILTASLGTPHFLPHGQLNFRGWVGCHLCMPLILTNCQLRTASFERHHRTSTITNILISQGHEHEEQPKHEHEQLKHHRQKPRRHLMQSFIRARLRLTKNYYGKRVEKQSRNLILSLLVTSASNHISIVTPLQ